VSAPPSTAPNALVSKEDPEVLTIRIDPGRPCRAVRADECSAGSPHGYPQHMTHRSAATGVLNATSAASAGLSATPLAGLRGPALTRRDQPPSLLGGHDVSPSPPHRPILSHDATAGPHLHTDTIQTRSVCLGQRTRTGESANSPGCAQTTPLALHSTGRRRWSCALRRRPTQELGRTTAWVTVTPSRLKRTRLRASCPEPRRSCSGWSGP
jgi:hypothetical protein